MTMTRTPICAAVALVAAMATPSLAAETDQERANKALVERVFAEFYNGRNTDTLAEYMAADLIQHNPNEKDGITGLVEYFEEVLWASGQEMNGEIIRIVAEGDLVFTQARWAPPGTTDPWAQGSMAVADLYRIEGGKLAEHWDVIQFVPEASVNGNTMFDGGIWHPESEAVEEANKQVVLRYFSEGMNAQNLGDLDRIVAEDWVAHNPLEPNGLAGLKSAFSMFFEQAPDLHADTKRLIADGNFVVAHNHYTIKAQDRGNDWAQPSGATFDLFRLEDGMIVEHWDIGTRDVPSSSASGHSMFDGGALYAYRN